MSIISNLRLSSIAIIVFISLSFGCNRFKEEIKARKLRRLCTQIEIGMTEDQVISIMGEPEGKDEVEFRGRLKFRYYYSSPYGVSTLTQINFDAESKEVIEAVCGEE